MPFCHIQLTARKPPSPAYPRELKTLGDHLRKRRLDLGLLQPDVALELRVNEMTISNWETNHTSPQLRLIPRILTFLGYCPYHTHSESLGKRIRARRRLLGISQKDLARKLNIDPGTLGTWESGRGKPSKAHMSKLVTWLSASKAIHE